MTARDVIDFFLSKQVAKGLRFPFHTRSYGRFEHSPPDLKVS
jgi:hypothetical protein